MIIWLKYCRNKRKLLNVKGKSKVIQQTENGNKENWRLSGILSRKLCDPTIWKNRTNIFSAFESTIK
jgi:hypothetical protein